MKSFLIIILITASNYCAQAINITIEASAEKAALYELKGEETFLIDSIGAKSNGRYSLSADDYNLHTGFYRLTLNNRKRLNFIFDGRDVNLKTHLDYPPDSLKVLQSESNRLYYKFLELNREYKQKTELLRLVLSQYPDEDDYYHTTRQKLQQIQNEYIEFVNLESQKDTASFIASYIYSAQLPIVDINIPKEEYVNYLKKHALDYVNFNNAGLIYSDLFTSKSIEYLIYFRNPQLPKGLLEKEFMKAVDTLLTKASVNIMVYEHIANYLIDGFRSFGFDKIIDYILENYIIKDELCLDEQTESTIQRRIEQAKNLKKGMKVPDFSLPNSNGNEFELSEIKSAKTLLVFYQSDCPHCKDLMPKLDDYYKEKSNNMEIVAIALDQNEQKWQKFISKNELSYINLREPDGWDGEIATAYSIYATPTMFLLDETKEIISKPQTFQELEKFMNALHQKSSN